MKAIFKLRIASFKLLKLTFALFAGVALVVDAACFYLHVLFYSGLRDAHFCEVCSVVRRLARLWVSGLLGLHVFVGHCDIVIGITFYTLMSWLLILGSINRVGKGF